MNRGQTDAEKQAEWAAGSRALGEGASLRVILRACGAAAALCLCCASATAAQSDPAAARHLLEQAQRGVHARWSYYKQLSEMQA